MKLSENISYYRKAAQISQEELAEKCKVSRQAVTKWEMGQSAPSLEKILFLADLFEVTLDELTGRTIENSTSKLLEYVKQFAVDDIPKSEEDDISAIVCRYIIFMKGLGIEDTDIVRGLKSIFLQDDMIGSL